MKIGKHRLCSVMRRNRDGGIGMPWYIVLVAVGIASRMLPHPPNVTAIAALGLFAGSRGHSRLGWFMPVAVLLITDFWQGGYAPLSMLLVYAGFAAGAAVGRYRLRGERSIGRIASASVMTSTVFFVLSNFGWWVAGGGYEHTLSGLATCYVAALPWFGASLVGDLCYSILLIGGYDWVAARGLRGVAELPRGVHQSVPT